MNVYLAHAAYYGTDGTDILVTVHDNGRLEVALRPGHEERWTTWGPPVELTLEDWDIT